MSYETKKKKIGLAPYLPPSHAGKTDRARDLEDRAAWGKALDRAQGAKVRDDEARLKKSARNQVKWGEI